MNILATLTCQTTGPSINAIGNAYHDCLPRVNATHDSLTTALNIVIGVVAALSVLFLVVGGLRYVVSDGDPQDAAKARSTIIYAIVGLIICILAESVVTFVLTQTSL